MAKRRFVKDLYEHLPGLVGAGVVDDAVADRMREHYGPPPEGLGLKTLIVFLSVVGAVLIGSGLIMVLGHNWEDLGRPVRAVIAFLPLLAGQAAVLWTGWKAPDSLAWREASSSFLTLSIGLCIALIAQTYHMPGAFDTFLVIWMVLALPLVYALRSTLPAILYLAGTVWWAGYRQYSAGHALEYWLLLALVLPAVILATRESAWKGRAVYLRWGLVLSLTVTLGIVLEKAIPGLWIPVYLGFFGLAYLAGGLLGDEADSMWQQPFRVVGGAGAALMALLLSWVWPWEEIGWHHVRHGSRFHSEVAWVDLVLTAVLVIGALVLLVTAVRRRRKGDLLLGTAPVVGVIGYALAATGSEALSVILFNLYTLVIALGLVVVGLTANRLRAFNGGMVLFAGLALARFFDEDIPFLVKGFVFIALGIAFLVFNVLILRRKGGAR